PGVAAPPRPAGGRGTGGGGGQQAPHETAAYPHSGPAEPEADGDRAEPTGVDQAREGWLLGRAGGPGLCCLSRGRFGAGHVISGAYEKAPGKGNGKSNLLRIQRRAQIAFAEVRQDDDDQFASALGALSNLDGDISGPP